MADSWFPTAVISHFYSAVYDRFDAPTFVEYLKAMQKHFGKVAAVVDRASPHRAKLVRKLLRKNKNIRIIYLPKGSPYLNAVEECWRRGKQVLLVSEYYKTFTDMCSAISTYYRTARFTLDILKFANRKGGIVLHELMIAAILLFRSTRHNDLSVGLETTQASVIVRRSAQKSSTMRGSQAQLPLDSGKTRLNDVNTYLKF